jgi:uncharacterized circularly permuted ATP-grasp superfamily protein
VLVTVGRLDMLVGPAGFAFIELNADSPAGLTDQLLIERTLLQAGVKTPAPHRALLSALEEAYRAWSGGQPLSTIAIVDWADAATNSEFEVLSEQFKAAGYTALVVAADELRFDGNRLWAGEHAIDLVYRRLITQELLARHGLDHPLLAAYRERRVCVANSFRTKLVNKKAAFAILSDPRFAELFSLAERSAIERHVPWTRLVRSGVSDYHGRSVELLDLVLKERQNLVLKPNDDYGGSGVLLGWQTDENVWAEAVRGAEGLGMIVQERRPMSTLNLPTFSDGIVYEDVFFDVCPFVFAGKMEGAMVRLSASQLSNVSAGGGVTGLVVLDTPASEAQHV